MTKAVVDPTLIRAYEKIDKDAIPLLLRVALDDLAEEVNYAVRIVSPTLNLTEAA